MVRSFDFDQAETNQAGGVDQTDGVVVQQSSQSDEIVTVNGQPENLFMWRNVSVNAIRFLPNADGFAMATNRGHVIFARPKEW
jgi:hypothetical protein